MTEPLNDQPRAHKVLRRALLLPLRDGRRTSELREAIQRINRADRSWRFSVRSGRAVVYGAAFEY